MSSPLAAASRSIQYGVACQPFAALLQIVGRRAHYFLRDLVDVAIFPAFHGRSFDPLVESSQRRTDMDLEVDPVACIPCQRQFGCIEKVPTEYQGHLIFSIRLCPRYLRQFSASFEIRSRFIPDVGK